MSLTLTSRAFRVTTLTSTAASVVPDVIRRLATRAVFGISFLDHPLRFWKIILYFHLLTSRRETYLFTIKRYEPPLFISYMVFRFTTELYDFLIVAILYFTAIYDFL